MKFGDTYIGQPVYVTEGKLKGTLAYIVALEVVDNYSNAIYVTIDVGKDNPHTFGNEATLEIGILESAKGVY